MEPTRWICYSFFANEKQKKNTLEAGVACDVRDSLACPVPEGNGVACRRKVSTQEFRVSEIRRRPVWGRAVRGAKTTANRINLPKPSLKQWSKSDGFLYFLLLFCSGCLVLMISQVLTSIFSCFAIPGGWILIWFRFEFVWNWSYLPD